MLKNIMTDNVPQKCTVSKIHQAWINTKTKALIRKTSKHYQKTKETNPKDGKKMNSELSNQKLKDNAGEHTETM